MRSGLSIAESPISGGRKVLLRTPKWEDLDGLLALINSLVEERAEIAVTEKLTREQEAVWLADLLVRLEKDDVFFLVAEVNGEVIGSSDLHPGKGSEKIMGQVGIAVKDGFRNMGIGSRMMQSVVRYAKEMGLRVLELRVFATNARALHFYEKLGFLEVGRVLRKHFHKGNYVDEVVMALDLR